jgi:hypothetical protein
MRCLLYWLRPPSPLTFRVANRHALTRNPCPSLCVPPRLHTHTLTYTTHSTRILLLPPPPPPPPPSQPRTTHVPPPLLDFVELPSSMGDLVFANVICGVIRGALEMVHMRVECRFTADMLKGDPVNAIRWASAVFRTAPTVSGPLCERQTPPPPPCAVYLWGCVEPQCRCRAIPRGVSWHHRPVIPPCRCPLRRLELKEIIEEAAGEDYADE